MCECPICLQEASLPKILECGHTFCNNCITEWYNTGDGTYRQCPICQCDLTGEDFVKESDITIVSIDNIELPITTVPITTLRIRRSRRYRRFYHVDLHSFKVVTGLIFSTGFIIYVCHL